MSIMMPIWRHSSGCKEEKNRWIAAEEEVVGMEGCEALEYAIATWACLLGCTLLIFFLYASQVLSRWVPSGHLSQKVGDEYVSSVSHRPRFVSNCGIAFKEEEEVICLDVPGGSQGQLVWHYGKNLGGSKPASSSHSSIRFCNSHKVVASSL